MLKHLMLQTEPHVADPAWRIPAAEVVDGKAVKIIPTKEVLEILWDMRFQEGRQLGLNESSRRFELYLKSIHWQEPDILKALLWTPK